MTPPDLAARAAIDSACAAMDAGIDPLELASAMIAVAATISKVAIGPGSAAVALHLMARKMDEVSDNGR